MSMASDCIDLWEAEIERLRDSSRNKDAIIASLRTELAQARKDIERKNAALRRALPYVEAALFENALVVAAIICAALYPLPDERKAG